MITKTEAKKLRALAKAATRAHSKLAETVVLTSGQCEDLERVANRRERELKVFIASITRPPITRRVKP